MSDASQPSGRKRAVVDRLADALLALDQGGQ
jgi:hypothetical protein